jgi:hypothetical protein
MPGLRGTPAGDDDHVGAGDVVVAGRPLDAGVVAEDGAVLLEVQRLALGQARLLGDVEQPDVAQLVPRGQGGQLATNVSSADERDLLAGHARNLRCGRIPSVFGGRMPTKIRGSR